MRALKFLLIIIFIISLQFVSAQNNRKIDSLIGVANSFIFKNPKKTIAIGEQLIKRNDLSDSYKISSYILISNGFSAQNDFEKSIKFAIKANEISEKANDNANRIRTLGLIGNQYIRLEMRDEAWIYLDKADKLSQTAALPDSMRYLIGNINLLKGFLYKRSLDCAYAIKHFNRAISAFKKDQGKGFAAANLGQAYNQKGYCFLSINKDSAQVSFEKGLADARKNGAKSLECNALVGLSEIPISKNDFKTANDTLLSALSLAKASNQTEMESRIYKLLASNYLALDDIPNHLHYQKLYEARQLNFDQEEMKSVNEMIKNRNEFKQKIYEDERKNLITAISVLVVVLIATILFLGYSLVNKRKNIDKSTSVVKN